MSLLETRLTKEWALQVIPPEKKMFGAILYDLQEMGKKIAAELELRDYADRDEFLGEHARGQSPLAKLEGFSTAAGDGVFVLRKCPMGRLVESLKVDGKLPRYYIDVVQKYIDLYRSKGAIIHPFCIVHQVIRAQVGESVNVGGRKMLVYQIACRSLSSGKVVYAAEGTSKVGMGREDIDGKIDGSACMYLVRF